MIIEHNANEIFSYLGKTMVGVLGTLDGETKYVKLRLMYYGFDDKFNVYFMATKGSPKVKHILFSSNISFIVFGIEEPLDNTWEIEIEGRAELLKEAEKIKYAMEKLKGRNPFADVAIESGSDEQFDMIKLNSKTIKFRLYGEALSGMAPTIINL